MVDGNLAFRSSNNERDQVEKDYTFLSEKPKHTSILLSDIVKNSCRFEASAFSLDAKISINKIKNCKYGYVNLWSKLGLIKEAFHCPRFKRIYLNKSELPIYQPSLITDVYPRPLKYISDKTNTDIDVLRVKKGMVLLTVSGTIGKSSFVSKTLDNKIFSHDLLRIIGKGEFDAGFIYSYLRTEVGLNILQANNYGAVVQHIEPEHLKKVIIPNAPKPIKKKIHELIVKSYDLRDQSNALMDKAEKILYGELQLPSIVELAPEYFDSSKDVDNYQIKLSSINLRFDGSYHLPVFKSIESTVSNKAKKMLEVRNESITRRILLPGRFKRTYVENKELGIKFIGGKQINELNPNSDKYLSKSIHKSRATSELILTENTILITRSGTIGKVAIVPKHWDSWAANEHIIRVFPASKDVAGYLYAWLNSDYGHYLIRKHTYGSVVDEIDANHVGDIKIPLLKNENKQKEINDLVLNANELRYKAYLKEQEAINIMNDEVINLEKKEQSVAEFKARDNFTV